jgi:xylulokinase
LSGLRSTTEPADLARAAFEGVLCGLLDGADALGAAGVTPDNSAIRLVGGGSRSPAYGQILADLAGRPVRIPDGDEHVAAGACVQAAAVLTETNPSEIARAWGFGRGTTIEPRSIDRRAVREAYAELRDAT